MPLNWELLQDAAYDLLQSGAPRAPELSLLAPVGIKTVVVGTISSHLCSMWTPNPVIVTIRDNRGYIRLSYSYYTTMTG